MRKKLVVRINLNVKQACKYYQYTCTVSVYKTALMSDCLYLHVHVYFFIIVKRYFCSSCIHYN